MRDNKKFIVIGLIILGITSCSIYGVITQTKPANSKAEESVENQETNATGIPVVSKASEDLSKYISGLDDLYVVYEGEKLDLSKGITFDKEKVASVVVKESQKPDYVPTEVKQPTEEELKKEEEAKKLEESKKNEEKQKEEPKKDTPKKDKKSTNQESQKVENSKVWKEAEYKTVHYEEVKVVDVPAETETIDVYEEQCRDICNGCGKDITGYVGEHLEKNALEGNYTCGSWHTDFIQVKVDTKEEKTEEVSHTELKWVVDTPAWDEQVLVREAGWY